jgi:hypothetical protein
MPGRSADDVRIETYSGPRDNLRRLFELAEDSAAELDAYIDAGRVLVATAAAEIIGHLQLTGIDDPSAGGDQEHGGARGPSRVAAKKVVAARREVWSALFV